MQNIEVALIDESEENEVVMVCASIRAAARKIGCNESEVRMALTGYRNKQHVRDYLVRPLSDYAPEDYAHAEVIAG